MIRLEWIPDAVPPVVLLWGGHPAEFAVLRAAFARLAAGAVTSVAVDDLDVVERVGSARLDSLVGAPRGVEERPQQPNALTCTLDAQGWSRAAALLGPFEEQRGSESGFQYIADVGQVELIVSTDRGW